MTRPATIGDLPRWRGVRVLLTGHSGFVGGWVAHALAGLGAEVYGLALAPDTTPAFHSLARVSAVLAGEMLGVDLRDAGATRAVVAAVRPRLVLHLAAEPIVRRAHAEPVATFATNVMGTVHLLDALQAVAHDGPGTRAVVVFTSDKVYENRGLVRGYREDDPLGDGGVYGASKAAQEMVTRAWRDSLLGPAGTLVASLRAGNVVGGGDWGPDRLIPDAVRAFGAGLPLALRRPEATRPFQHVIDAVRGLVVLAERLIAGDASAARPWNVGPRPPSPTVGDVAARIAALWGPECRVTLARETGAAPEATLLAVDAGAFGAAFDWAPALDLDAALVATVAWYKAAAIGADMAETTRAQLAAAGLAQQGSPA